MAGRGARFSGLGRVSYNRRRCGTRSRCGPRRGGRRDPRALRLAISVNNQPVRPEQNVNEKWAQVQNVHQRRADLIPNLVETVKGFAAQERTRQIRADSSKVVTWLKSWSSRHAVMYARCPIS